MSQKLTDEQIANLRIVLASLVGPYAFLMSKEQITYLRDNMQRQIDYQEELRLKYEAEEQERCKPRNCDPVQNGTTTHVNGEVKSMERLEQIYMTCHCNPARNGTTTHVNGKITCNYCHKERKVK